MGFAIQLVFDQKTDAIVQAIWQKLGDRQIAPYMHSSGNRPHISLAIFETIDLDAGRDRLVNLINNTASFEIIFSHLGVFTTPKAVVFAAPTITSQLLKLHTEVHKRLTPISSAPWEHYLPEHWVPHCTLGMDLPLQAVTPAIEIAQQLDFPFQARILALDIIEFRPVQHLFTISLAGISGT